MSIDPTHPWAARATELLAEVGLPADYAEAYIDEDDLLVEARGEVAGRLIAHPAWDGDDVAEGLATGKAPGATELWAFRRRLDA